MFDGCLGSLPEEVSIFPYIFVFRTIDMGNKRLVFRVLDVFPDLKRFGNRASQFPKENKENNGLRSE